MKHRRSLSAIFILCILCAAVLAGCKSKPSVTPGNNVQDGQGKSDTDSVTDTSGAADVITTETVILGYGATAEMTLVNGKYTTGILLNEGKEQGKLTAEYSKAADGTEYVSKVNISYEDKTGTITLNEKQDILTKTSYDENGNVENSETFEYTYDANGKKTKRLNYYNGKLSKENEYAINSKNESYINKITLYLDDGSKQIQEYNEYGDEILYELYDINGNRRNLLQIENVYDDNGRLLSYKWYQNNELTDETIYSFDSESPVNQISIHYLNGVKSYETVVYNHPELSYYNEKNERIPELYTHSRIDYDTSGNIISETVYEYDSELNQIGRKEYDKDGKLTASYVTEYEFFENGTVKKQTEYKNGKISTENEYAYNENHRYLARNTEYDENGNVTNESIYGFSIKGRYRYPLKKTSIVNGKKTVDEFREDGFRLSRKVYSADGTLKEDRRYEIEYFENGSTKLSKEYNFDKLASLSEYKLENDTSVLYKTTQYDENGDKTLTTERSKNKDGKFFTSKLTHYNGKRAYVTEYFDTNKRISEKSYDENGNLVNERLYAVGADGNTYLTKETSISERTHILSEYDGKGGFTVTTYKVPTKNVTEYDESGKITYKATYENDKLVKEERH